MSVTAREALAGRWRDLRDDARGAPAVRACIDFAWDVGLITMDERELWLRRITTCPGHDDEGGRSWCAYCGDIPKDA
jgi:hypothetical protein